LNHSLEQTAHFIVQTDLSKLLEINNFFGEEYFAFKKEVNRLSMFLNTYLKNVCKELERGFPEL